MTKPDWKNTEDYTFTKELTPEGWAWEFLRRSPDYQKAYDEYLNEAKKLEDQFGPDWRTDPKAHVYDPPLGKNDWVDGFLLYGDPDLWQRRHLKWQSHLKWIYQFKAKPFGLDDMYDPQKSLDQGVKFIPWALYPRIIETQDQANDLMKEFDVWSTENDEPDSSIIAVTQDIALVAFDLNLSIGRQIKDLSKNLTKIRAERGLKKPKAPSENPVWTLYLRVLDARQDGVSHKVIGETLWPEKMKQGGCNEASKENHKQAQNWLRCRQYLRLLLMD